MKKILALLIVMVLVLPIAACSGDPDPVPPGGNGPEGSLEDILAKIYESEELSEQFRSYAADGLITSEITEANMEYHLGITGVEFEEAIASEPIMSASAYSLCLLRVKAGTDIEQLKQDIKNNVDPFKWVCVGVDQENVIVDNIDDLVILIMSNSEAQILHQIFLSLDN